MSEEAVSEADHIELVSDIISAYVSKNNVPVSELPTLIQSVHATLAGLGKPREAEPVKLTPLMSIKKTVTPDAIISLEDGKPYKTLRRHLAKYGLTADQYRQKWGLPPDYPMVAANYAAQRSELAKTSGLGQSRKQQAVQKRAFADATVSGPAASKRRPGLQRKVQ